MTDVWLVPILVVALFWEQKAMSRVVFGAQILSYVVCYKLTYWWAGGALDAELRRALLLYTIGVALTPLVWYWLIRDAYAAVPNTIAFFIFYRFRDRF